MLEPLGRMLTLAALVGHWQPRTLILWSLLLFLTHNWLHFLLQSLSLMVFVLENFLDVLMLAALVGHWQPRSQIFHHFHFFSHTQLSPLSFSIVMFQHCWSPWDDVDVGRPRRALAASQLWCAIEDRGPTMPLPLLPLRCLCPTLLSKGPTSWLFIGPR